MDLTDFRTPPSPNGIYSSNHVGKSVDFHRFQEIATNNLRTLQLVHRNPHSSSIPSPNICAHMASRAVTTTRTAFPSSSSTSSSTNTTMSFTIRSSKSNIVDTNTNVSSTTTTTTSTNTTTSNTSIGTITASTNDRSPTSNVPTSSSKGKRCQVCSNTFKGNRGLSIHLGRSPDCKRNISNSDRLTNNMKSLPQTILDTVKCPSTSVESLENLCGNGVGTKIQLHGSKSCHLCFNLSTKDKFVSSSTHRIYDAVIPNQESFLDCKCSNVIYLLTCRKCKLQYVGETAQMLRERIGKHASSIKHPENENTCRILAEHFSQGFCRGATFSVNIIEKLPGNGRDLNNHMDPTVTNLRRKKEKEWMLTLRTVYPYGLNSRVGDEYIPEYHNSSIFSKFPALKRIKQHLKVRTKFPTSNTFILDNFIYIINESIRNNIKNTMNLIRVLLSSLKKSHCHILADRINDYLLDKHDTFRFSQFFSAALDICQYKIGTPSFIQPSKKSPPSNCCHIKFNNKALDFINIHKIMRDKDTVDSLPRDLRNDIPTVIYQLTDSIRSKLFNYKDFVQTLNVDAFIEDNNTLPCDCHNSPFMDSDHNHILTGDLNIISDSKLKALITKGPKYREPLPFSFDKAKSEIILGLDTCIDTWCSKTKFSKSLFQEWKNTIISKIDERVSSFSRKKNKKKHHSILKLQSSKECLSDLHSKFVMVPIDKASNNIAFICKRFYAIVLLQELGLIGSSSSTYTKLDQLSPDEVIKQHITELKQKFNITVGNKMSTLPDIYWIPKLHKNPVKFRFIIASKFCTSKTLSKDVSSMFSLFQKQVDTYYKKSHFFSGIKSYWIVQDRRPILEAVKKSIARRSAKCVSSFDFSTLYTKIPHNKLIDVLTNIIEFVFKGGTRNKISIHSSGLANWVTNGNNRSSIVYTKESVIEAVSFLIKNCHFKLGNKLFRQDIGIPMGSDPAPAFANLFLFYYESSWLKSIKKNNYVLARKFGQVFRYIDDLVALNDGHSFETFHEDIYPEELALNKENSDSHSTNFLDLHIEIENGVFTTRLFDKRDHFGFNIARLPYRDSNIPNKMFYSSIAAESLRIFRASSTCNRAILSIQSLVKRMINQGANIPNMKNCISKMINRHQINLKYGTINNDIINRIFFLFS